ncbi:Zn-ribbon-containing protein [Allokutzneria multivorans]|uniref:Zn-ribbon-containing protein n=1 Tax=Allokutzneria multivorans TaxID=1142134 RepID=A0ABP7SB87_9PSEU
MVHVVQLTFAKTGVPAVADEDARADAVNGLLGALRQNGQILGLEWPIFDTGTEYRVVVMVPEPVSLDPRLHNQWVRRDLDGLTPAGLDTPLVEVLGLDPGGAQPCDCQAPSGYLLWTTFTNLESPLRCLDCFGPIPLYRIPPTDHSGYNRVLSWQSDYQACDTLQMNCSTLEHPSLAEMSGPHSSLTQRGREICAQIVESTGRPTYYYLFRYSGRRPHREERLTCPFCHRGWRLAKRLHDEFDFRCDHCQLVSSRACR